MYTVTQYIQGGCLELSKIEGKISKETRALLLRWIETAMLSGSGRGVTEGEKFLISYNVRRCFRTARMVISVRRTIF